jgi:hypothetical protein
MTVDLISLVSKFSNNHDVETESAFFRTKVPQVAPEAYLHTIYKPAPESLVTEVSRQLKFPTAVLDFYHHWNGANLFVNVLAVFGCVPSGALLNRTERFKLPPFDLLEVNRELAGKLSGTKLIALAAYGFDGSLVCVDPTGGEIVCFVGENISSERIRWKSIDEWLETEIGRIAFLFDERGNRLVGKEQLLPTSTRMS